MIYVLNDAMVTSVRPSGSAQDGDGMPSEEVSFSYGKIEWTYMTTDQTGKETGKVSGHCDRS